jgi:hypothetical protein
MKRVPRTLKNRASEMIRFSVFRKATSHFDHQFTIQAEKVKGLAATCLCQEVTGDAPDPRMQFLRCLACHRS